MKKYWGFYFMFIPVLVFVALFHYAPMFGIRYAFYSWKIVGDPVWVGLANFEKLFKQQHTVKLAVVAVDIASVGLACAAVFAFAAELDAKTCAAVVDPCSLVSSLGRIALCIDLAEEIGQVDLVFMGGL